MPRFVIHVGPHKTGSTYLQSAFAALADPLAARGVLWPRDLGSKGHDELPRRLQDPAQHDAVAAQIRTHARSGYETVLLSAEDLSRLDPGAIAAFGRMLDGAETVVVFYCRAWADVTMSQWNQHIRNGFTTPLDEMMRRHLDRPRQSGPINYGAKLDRWAGVFGTGAIRLVCLEALDPTHTPTLPHFAASFLGIADLPTPPAAALVANPSMGTIDIEIIRALNLLSAQHGAARESRIAALYLQRRATLDLACVTDAMQSCEDSIVFDESLPALDRLHRRLFAAYGHAVVQPRHNDRRFFTPHQRALPYIRPDYRYVPTVCTALQLAYAALA